MNYNLVMHFSKNPTTILTLYKGGSVGWGWNPVCLQFAIISSPYSGVNMKKQFSSFFGEQTIAKASGIICWYEQWVCKSTEDRKAVWVGWVWNEEKKRKSLFISLISAFKKVHLQKDKIYLRKGLRKLKFNMSIISQYKQVHFG